MAIAIKKSSKRIKKNLEKDIAQILEKALVGFKDVVGEKKFSTRIKKASKQFLKGTSKKIQLTAAKPVKKKAANRTVKKTAEKRK